MIYKNTGVINTAQDAPVYLTKFPLKKHQKLDESNNFAYNQGFYELSNNSCGESAMWIAVLTQAVMDSISRANNSEARTAKNDAIRWLTGNSKDFVDVCLLAGYDPDYIRLTAKRVIANPKRWRAEPGEGKRYQERRAYRERAEKRKPMAPKPKAPAIVIAFAWQQERGA
jgi:hypothetical protein